MVKVIDTLPRWAESLKNIPLPKDAWVAGGSMQSLLSGYKVKDFDIFSKDISSALNFYKIELGAPVVENDFIADFTFGQTKIQVVKKFPFDSAVSTIEQFDFTIICAAYDGTKLYLHDDFYEHSASKTLVINNLPKPLSTFNRTLKYISRGYTMCPINRGKLIRTIHEKNIDWTKPEENELEFYPDGSPRFLGLD